jgi:hypothetical protein
MIYNCPNQTTEIIHPADWPDGAPRDLFLFGHLKREMTGFTASAPEEISSKIRRIFEEIPKETPAAAYTEWITTIERIIERKEECHIVLIKRKSSLYEMIEQTMGHELLNPLDNSHCRAIDYFSTSAHSTGMIEFSIQVPFCLELWARQLN